MAYKVKSVKLTKEDKRYVARLNKKYGKDGYEFRVGKDKEFLLPRNILFKEPYRTYLQAKKRKQELEKQGIKAEIQVGLY